MSETAAKTTPGTSKPRKKRRKARGRAAKRATKKVRKASTKKKTRGAAKVTKAKPRRPKKSASASRGGSRAPQGKRLGKWQFVKQAEVFAHLENTGTTIATLARTLGVGASAVHAWKAGRRYPSEQAQLKLRQILQGDLAPVAAPKAKGRGGRGRAFNGKAFRRVREERGLSRARLSKQMGVSAGSIRNWEAGVSRPRGGNLSKCEAFLAEGAQAAAPQALSGLETARPAALATAKGGSDAAVLGAVQVTTAFLAAGNSMTPDETVRFVGALRQALS